MLNDVRKNFVDFVFDRLNEIKQLKERIKELENQNSKTTVKQEFPIDENSKTMVKLIGFERRIYELLEKQMRFMDLVESLGKSKQNVNIVLRRLIKKGVVTKTEYSKKNVIYYRT